MRILEEYPPIYANVAHAFQVNPKVVFTYGDTIYNPHKLNLTPDIIHHEKVHIKQQKGNDEDAAMWWGRYLREPAFRLDQEAEAYKAQYQFLCKTTKDRELKHRWLVEMARILSGPLYDHCVGHAEAMLLIKQ